MCGLGAVVSKNQIEEAFFRRFCDRVKHRGPDASLCTFENLDRGWVALGHQRLSIIDRSKRSDQPFCVDDYIIIFNGEIYNYKEIRADLRQNGVCCETESDTEVLLRSFIVWGEECLHKLNGMFSFIVLDRSNETVFFARDRFGVKPLYFLNQGGDIYFASELKQFLEVPGYIPVGNLDVIGNFVQNRFLDYSENTFFDNVFQLPPGFKGRLSLQNFELETHRWYCIESSTMPQKSFYEIFENAVRLRLRSDVDVGSCLSGGLDSTSIVCMVDSIKKMTELSSMPTKVFTSCFDDPRFDERPLIDFTASLVDIERHSVFPQADDFFETVSELIYFLDEPFWSFSMFAQARVFSRVAESGVQVILDGQGADEVFGGYLSLVYGSYFNSLSIVGKISEFFAVNNKVRFGKFLVRSYLTRNHSRCRNRIMKDAFDDHAKSSFSSLKEHTSFLLRYHLPALLHYEDRNSMRYSVEARLPFLDYQIVEFGVNSSDFSKIGGFVGKKVVREAMCNLVPEQILSSRFKRGFETPQRHWMEARKSVVEEYLIRLFDFGIFDSIALQKVLMDFKRGRYDLGLVTRLFALSVWIKVFNIRQFT